MNKITDTIGLIKGLDVDLNGDLIREYLHLRDIIDINKYVDYERPSEYTGYFQMGINVQINADSEFIPFLMFNHSNQEKKEKARKAIIELVPQKAIKYNYTQFYQDVVELLKKNNYTDNLLSEFFFDVTYSSQSQRYLISKFSIDIDDDNRPSSVVNNAILTQINELLIKQQESDFVQKLTELYYEFGAQELHYVIVAFDEDCATKRKLTHFIGIAENTTEPQEFLFKYIRKCRNFVSLIRTRYMMDLLQKNKHESIKSAISAIMSRNMSHNLGSHYMYYTKAYLESIATNAGNISPDIRGAAKVLGYVQARMDYLATVISNDKYPYGAVNFKSQLYDELTVDDFSHRHFPAEANKRITNFLLTNLIYSENFSRPDVRCDEKLELKGNKLFLYVKYSEDGKSYENFTGTWHNEKYDWVLDEIDKANDEGRTPLPTIDSEQKTKNRLSSLNIALPGGSMSCHAFFNVVENFIRNSAKYLSGDINKEEGLICTIAIQPNEDQKYVDVVIYDNKQNANKEYDTEKKMTLYQEILEKLASLVIIDNQNKITKDNKGFKEILFSAIWMRAYTFGKRTYADIVTEINQTESGDKKLDKIEKYGFSLVKVKEGADGNISIFKRHDTFQDTCNLGLLITLPVFKQTDTLTLTNDRTKDINNMLNTMSDIVEVDEDFMKSEFRHVFTHTINKKEDYTSVLEKYRAAIQKRFPDINEYAISFGTKETAESTFEKADKQHRIYFQRHLSTQEGISKFDGYAYADSISGGNFTITLLDLFKKGYKNSHYLSDDDEILALKIKESALTRVTLIDERLHNSTKESDYPWLALRNVRVLNYSDESTEAIDGSFATIFKGSEFKDRRNETHFLSIHLGLIEKILKNSSLVNALINRRLHQESGNEDKTLASNRVDALMDMIKEYFGGENKESLYIAIHSGRGNYSAELEGPLSTYPFITLSALENAYNNSKYQLTQLLYNTVYIGKGLANKSHK